ncbi:hypothetical protein [Herbaspirillum seropedicae]|uniref:hypothetical protein n=1 Tax=Herbaspirillum seropedicae TaxID=964 RepID=UPI0012EA3A2D|nr:hypothetical protein [Herbaspirillum seropedicae]
MLADSLNLLWNHLSWPPSRDSERTKTIDQFGHPFTLSYNNAPYVPMFVRATDRALYHAGNAWERMALGLSHIHLTDFLFGGITPDVRVQHGDQFLVHEIEAFLAAVGATTEINLTAMDGGAGRDRENRLGKSIGALGIILANDINVESKAFEKIWTERKWRELRNGAYHLKASMRENNYGGYIQKIGSSFVLKLDGVHFIEGVEFDFVEVFTHCFNAFLSHVIKIRSLLTQFAFEKMYVPTATTYRQGFHNLGHMLTGLGPLGYEHRFFSETAKDFVGPPQSGETLKLKDLF